MVAITFPTRRSFLQERTIKFGIVQAFTSIWLLVLVIYYSKGQSFMSPLQASVYQFLISTNIITITFFLAFAALQVYSIRNQVAYTCSSVISEMTLIGVVVFLQTVAAIAFSASVHSFACSANSCRESVFFAIVAWLAPLLYVIHTVEFVARARRLSTPETSVWTTATWLVNWEQTAPVTESKDIEKGLAAPKALVLPVKAATKTSKSRESAHRTISAAYRNMRAKSMLPPALPPKSPRFVSVSEKDVMNNVRLSANGEQVLVIVPSKLQFSVPRLCHPPKYFIQIPENISYTVPRISKAPCPKTRSKERRKARKAAAAAAADATSPKKWVSTIMA
jgi:DNA-binding transcriptional regulator of glucitol operon